MDGIFIKSESMNGAMAEEILRLLQMLQISASSASQFLAIQASLQRIADGDDVVVESNLTEVETT